MKISKELSTGTLPMLVLSVLGSEDLYGYRIIKTLEARSDNAFSLKEGTLYPILHALEQEGCLESYWDFHRAQEKILPYYKERAQAAGEQKGGVHRFLRHGTESIVICIKGKRKRKMKREDYIKKATARIFDSRQKRAVTAELEDHIAHRTQRWRRSATTRNGQRRRAWKPWATRQRSAINWAHCTIGFIPRCGTLCFCCCGADCWPGRILPCGSMCSAMWG